MAFELIITNAGRAALVNAASTGTDAVTVTQIGVSATAVAANPALTALDGEFKRLGTVAGGAIAADKITLQVLDDSTDAYTLRSFALYLNDGTLFALYGQVDAILIKTPNTLAQLEADVLLADIDATTIEFGNPVFSNPPATETMRGIAKIATQAATNEALDDESFVTPEKAMGLINHLFPSGSNANGNWRKMPDGNGGYFIHQWGSNFTGLGAGAGNAGWSGAYEFPIPFTDLSSVQMKLTAQTLNVTGADSNLIAAEVTSLNTYRLGSEDILRPVWWEAWGR